MQVSIRGQSYQYRNDIRDNDMIRASFNALATKVFSLNFESWHQSGWWRQRFIPHVLMADDQVIANVSVNLIDLLWQGQVSRQIQLGTVMTDPDYRGRGCADWLMKRVLAEWNNRCDSMFLFANDEVVSFYPKYGFVPADEYQCQMPLSAEGRQASRLNMSNPDDRQLLLDTYQAGNPFSALAMSDCPELLMFYCSQFLQDCVYYDAAHQAVVIAEHQDHQLLCYDVFGGNDAQLRDILASCALESTRTLRLGFTPAISDQCQVQLRQEEDCTLFVLSGKQNLFATHQVMVPLLAHT